MIFYGKDNLYNISLKSEYPAKVIRESVFWKSSMDKRYSRSLIWREHPIEVF